MAEQRIKQINRQLNVDEDLDIINPYLEARPYLNDMIRQNRRLNLLEDKIFMPDFEEQVQQQTGELETLSNTNPIVNSQITGTTPVLGASGTNQALSKPYDQLSSIEKEQILFNRA